MKKIFNKVIIINTTLSKSFNLKYIIIFNR